MRQRGAPARQQPFVMNADPLQPEMPAERRAGGKALVRAFVMGGVGLLDLGVVLDEIGPVGHRKPPRLSS
jgi:hypothetical protein